MPEAALLLAALDRLLTDADPVPAASPFAALGGFRINLPSERTLRFWSGDALHSMTVRGSDGRFRFAGLDGIGEVAARRLPDGSIAADRGGTQVHGFVVTGDGSAEVRIAGQTWRLATRAPRKDAVAGASDGRIVAPMPGRVLAVDVVPGQTVAAGDRLLVLEAMKMEHRLTARAAGVVGAVHVSEGDQVADGTLLVEIG